MVHNFMNNMTYDELISISKTFINKNNRYHVQKDFSSINGFPGWNVINKILDKYNKSKFDYYKELGCNDYNLLSYYMTEDQRNKEFFPLELPSGIIIYYDYSDNPNSRKISWIHCHDQYGYKYYTKRQLMQHCQKNNNIPDKFRFDNKIYLEDNINCFLKNNNCIYKVYNIPDDCGGHDDIQLISKYGDITQTTVNEIICNVSRYTEKGHNLAIKRDQSLKMSKEEAESVIRQLMDKYDRPLAMKDINQKDDINNGLYISRKTIEKYWGTFSNMMYELNGKNGCSLMSGGFGNNYILPNGDFVRSTYENDFSNLLIKNNFKYNISYFRDVKYSDIFEEYRGSMNCDYKIIFNNKVLYVELAGMLHNDSDIYAFLHDIEIDNSIMERYRKKLSIKQQILRQANVNYKILLRPELNLKSYQNLIDDFMK